MENICSKFPINWLLKYKQFFTMGAFARIVLYCYSKQNNSTGWYKPKCIVKEPPKREWGKYIAFIYMVTQGFGKKDNFMRDKAERILKI